MSYYSILASVSTSVTSKAVVNRSSARLIRGRCTSSLVNARKEIEIIYSSITACRMLRQALLSRISGPLDLWQLVGSEYKNCRNVYAKKWTYGMMKLKSSCLSKLSWPALTASLSGALLRAHAFGALLLWVFVDVQCRTVSQMQVPCTEQPDIAIREHKTGKFETGDTD